MFVCLFACCFQLRFLRDNAEYSQLYLVLHGYLFDEIEHSIMEAAAKASADETFDPAVAGAALIKVAEKISKLVDLPLDTDWAKQEYVDLVQPYFTKICTDRVARNLETEYRHSRVRFFSLFLFSFCTFFLCFLAVGGCSFYAFFPFSILF